MIDFGALPPEINSARMYAGPGAGPMLAAAAAWDGLASGLGSTAASYGSAVTGLTDGPWLGPASMSMLAAATPYVAWLSATAGQAEQAATQAKLAAAAYEVAFAMTVPPPVVAANRSMLLSLIATNFFGQNTPAIAATEAHYAEMWAQDTTAMYGYAGHTAAASQVQPFTSPPHTTNPAGLSGHAVSVGHAAGHAAGHAGATHAAPTLPSSTPHLPSTVPHTLQALAQPTSSPAPTSPPPSSVPPGLTDVNNATSFFLSWTNGSAAHTLNFGMRGLFNFHEAPKAFDAVKAVGGGAAKGGGAVKPLGSAPSLLPGISGVGGGSPVAAGIGQAAQVGGVSVPPSFPGTVPGAAPAAAVKAQAVAAEDAVAVEVSGEALGGMPGVPGVAGRAGYKLRFVPRYGYRQKVMARPPGGG